MRAHVERMRDLQLDLAGVLRRAVHEHRAIFPRHCKCNLSFEVEVILAAATKMPSQPMRCASDGPRGIAARKSLGWQHAALRCQRIVDRQQRRQLGVFDACPQCRLPRGLDARGRDGEQRLPDVLHQLIGENRIVVDDRSAIVDTGDAGGRKHGHHARRCADGIQVQGNDSRMRLGAATERGVQSAARLDDVVDVRGLPCDVQVSALVRERLADQRNAGRGNERIVHGVA